MGTRWSGAVPRPGRGSAKSGGEVTMRRMSRYGPSNRATSPVVECPNDPNRQPPHRPAHDLLGARFGLLHDIAKALAGLELALEHEPLAVARDVRRRVVDEA